MIISCFENSPKWGRPCPKLDDVLPLKSFSLTCHSLRAAIMPILFSYTRISLTVTARKTRPSHSIPWKAFLAFVSKYNLRGSIYCVCLILHISRHTGGETTVSLNPQTELKAKPKKRSASSESDPFLSAVFDYMTEVFEPAVFFVVFSPYSLSPVRFPIKHCRICTGC